ncbi:unnamed protein product [Caenorhabditis brenneri]
MGTIGLILSVFLPCVAILVPDILIGLIIRGFYGPSSPINRRNASAIQTCLNDFRDDFDVDEYPENWGAEDEQERY